MTRKTLLLTITAIGFVLLIGFGFLYLNKDNLSLSQSIQSKCIVTILGEDYDVTKLQQTHSGGNVFQCGTDMTSLYESEHGSNLRRIQPYKVS